MNKVTITKTIKFPGEYTYELSNDHKIRISHDEYLREWHLSGIDKDGNNYEPCHPFHDSFRDAKSYLPEAIENIEKQDCQLETSTTWK